MEGLQVFQYQGKDVRTVDRDGQTWWVLADVCEVLDLTQPHRVASRLDDDERMTLTFNTGHSERRGRGGAQKITIINEPGLYSVILRSNKPEAKAFKRWITHEVLPTIHATGAYGGRQATPAIADTLERMTDVVEALTGRIEALERQVQEAPRLEAVVSDSEPAIPDLIRRRRWYRMLNEKMELLVVKFDTTRNTLLHKLYEFVEAKYDVILDEERLILIEKKGLDDCTVLETIYQNETFRQYFERCIDTNLSPENRGW